MLVRNQRKELELHIIWSVEDIKGVFYEFNYRPTIEECEEVLQMLDNLSPGITWQTIREVVDSYLMENTIELKTGEFYSKHQVLQALQTLIPDLEEYGIDSTDFDESDITSLETIYNMTNDTNIDFAEELSKILKGGK